MRSIKTVIKRNSLPEERITNIHTANDYVYTFYVFKNRKNFAWKFTKKSIGELSAGLQLHSPGLWYSRVLPSISCEPPHGPHMINKIIAVHCSPKGLLKYNLKTFLGDLSLTTLPTFLHFSLTFFAYIIIMIPI